MKVIHDLPLSTFSLYLSTEVFESMKSRFAQVQGDGELYRGIQVFNDSHLPENRGCAWSRNEKGETVLTIIVIGEDTEDTDERLLL